MLVRCHPFAGETLSFRNLRWDHFLRDSLYLRKGQNGSGDNVTRGMAPRSLNKGSDGEMLGS